MPSFPDQVCFTVTNRCNLRCRMCGQWGQEGYFLRGGRKPEDLPVEVWKGLADEVAAHGRAGLGLRGGEPFLYRGIVELLEHIKGKGLSCWMDTNGTLLEEFAGDVARLGIDALHVSIDGPERVHDAVRGVPGAYARIRDGMAAVREACAGLDRRPPETCIVFTIGPDSYRGLAELPDAARDLGVGTVVIVPYYWFDGRAGEQYERVMAERLGCTAWSWRGFRRETSGVDPDELAGQLRRFRENLGEVACYPFMNYSEADYRAWFGDCTAKVGRLDCRNPWRLLDIQPNGDANFCVDFPDYVVGNAARETIEEMWNGPRAEAFRSLLSEGPLPICNRCGAKYMSGSEPE